MRISILCLLALLFCARQASAEEKSVMVAVAANVKYAFEALSTAFTSETGITVKNATSSSGKLTAQITHGAPFDLFLSADMKYPEKLYQDGLAVTKPKIYANGTLVLWTMKEIDLSTGIAAMSSSNITKIAIANPKLAPYGAQAIRAMQYYKLDAAIKPKLIFGESISQVNQYIDSKSVDAGFTAKSVVVSPLLEGKGNWIALPKESYQPIQQGMVILRHGQSENNHATRKFYEFMSSAKAQAILIKFGYTLP
jgi:molybdate transport system substrate-binding protein